MDADRNHTRHWTWFDPGFIHLRDMVVTMVVALSCFASGLLLKNAAHLFDDTVILATVLAITMARSQIHADTPQRVAAFVALPIMAIAASEAAMLMGSNVALGDALFVIAVAAGVWIRRFGPRFSQFGTMITLPFIAILMIPSGLPFFGAVHALWSGVVALIVVCWVTTWQVSAHRLGLIHVPSQTPQQAAIVRHEKTQRRTHGLSTSDRMALQMAVALSIAFVLGHLIFSSHWIWAVLTAYIVCSGNRGRGDVVHKSAMRVIGAALGTLVATGLSGVLPSGDAVSIVLIFTVIGVAVWLRPVNYAFWAFSVTASLAFLYGYFGEGGPGLLGTRLEAILLGAVIGVATTWLVFPIRSKDVLRRREAGVMALLSAYLSDLGGTVARLRAIEDRFDHAMAQMDQVSRTLRAGNVAVGQRQTGPDVRAARALQRCASSVHQLMRLAETEPEVLKGPAVSSYAAGLVSDLAAIRGALGEQGQFLDQLCGSDESLGTLEDADRTGPALLALSSLHAALHEFAASRGLLTTTTCDPQPDVRRVGGHESRASRYCHSNGDGRQSPSHALSS